MATAMTAAQWKTAMAKWRVDVHYYLGWESRGRGPMGSVHGIVVHHTGSDSQSDNYLDFLFVVGRGDLPAPLCNVATDMDGDLHVGATRRANHAGSGSGAVLQVVEAESYDGYRQELHPGPDTVGGTEANGMYYGNEVRFDGGQPMTEAQWNTVVLSCAAICDFHGWSALSVIAHREWTRRKPDPGNTDMAKLRRDIRAALAAGPGGWPVTEAPPEEDDEMTAEQESAASGRYADLKNTMIEYEGRSLDRDQKMADGIAALTTATNNLITGVNTLTTAVNNLAAQLQPKE